jgi:hypothetical protein
LHPYFVFQCLVRFLNVTINGRLLMKMINTAVAAVALTLSALATAAHANEFGFGGTMLKPGVVLGAAAAAPPPGLYGFDQFIDYEAKLVGPGAPVNANGAATTMKGAAAVQGFVYVPGWTFLGATYDAVAAMSVISSAAGSPINATAVGMHNPYFANELSWKLGDTGFFVKAALGMWAPIGTIQGTSGLDNIGNPWWTFLPNVSFSYLKDGWNLTINTLYEINTENTVTKYLSGDVLHAEFTALKTIGKWTIGPVAYYVGQVTNDRSSAFTVVPSMRTVLTFGPPAGGSVMISVPSVSVFGPPRSSRRPPREEHLALRASIRPRLQRACLWWRN